MNILTIRDLRVKVGNKVILDRINLNLKAGESYILFGPNGSGKSTLINSIIGNPLYEIDSGKILFMDKNITNWSVDERSKLGISIAFQQPPEIMGIKLSDLLKLCLEKNLRDEFTENEKKLIKAFNLTKFLDREVNVGFSGGERKRAEILQMLFLKPKLLLLDEPDSGVDVESLKLIASKLQQYIEETGSSALIVTHKGDILEYVKSKYACVLLEGKTHCFVNPKRVYETIKKSGYEKCVACELRVKEEW
jgi:Fe-S cluster assembly ATP-binding protein